jgi:hypothetical protein
MMNMTPDDINQIVTLIDILLLSVAVSSVALGSLIGWYVRGRYEVWAWFKRGIYCNDCAPLVEQSIKDQ